MTTKIPNNKLFILDSNLGSSLDPLRAFMKKYWEEKNGNLSYKKNYEGVIGLENQSESKINESYILPSGLEIESSIISETFIMNGLNNSEIESLLSIKEELNSQEFIDYVFNLPSPIVYPSSQDNKSAMDGDVEFEYKYPLHGFEDLISEPDYPESSIINYYSYYVSIDSNGNPRPLEKQSINNTFEVGPIAETQELWADAKNYFFDSYYTGFNSPYNDLIKKDLLPFYANVKIESLSPKSEELSGNIIRRGIPYPTCQYISDLISPDGDFSFFDTVNFSNTNIQPEYRDETQTSFIEKKFIENQNIKLIDIYEMLNNIYAETSVNSSPPSQYIYRPKPPQTTTTKSIINANIQDFLEEVNSYEPRKYEEMLSGNLSPQSGVLFYKISKFSSDNPDVPLNSVWVPANNDKNKDIILNYVDSQVKYGKRYFYQVFAYKIVVGSIYSYELENYIKEDDVIINPAPPKGTLPPGDIVTKIDPPTKANELLYIEP